LVTSPADDVWEAWTLAGHSITVYVCPVAAQYVTQAFCQKKSA